MNTKRSEDELMAEAIAAAATLETAHELVNLVRKLHWIGLDDEARSLQQALGAIPASQRASVLATPASTD